MRSLGFIFLIVVLANAAPQLYVFGPAGQNEGPYHVNGVPGAFRNFPNRGEHVFIDRHGNSFVNRKQGSHSIIRPDFTALNQPSSPGTPPSGRLAGGLESKNACRTNELSGGNSDQIRDSRMSQSDRTLYFKSVGEVQGNRRSPEFVVSRLNDVVAGGGNYISRTRRDALQAKSRRNSMEHFVHPLGKYFDSREDDLTVSKLTRRHRSISDVHVQGKNFVVGPVQAGVWNDQVSIWRRPDGRTVTLDVKSGGGQPSQYYSG